MSEAYRFPPGFVWGAATSAYQIEGSPLADGAGPGIWHRFSHIPGRIANGDTGDVACDHYRRFAEDVSLMRQLGLQAYRFSLSWSRVFPEGKGAINSNGLGFYDRLVDRLLQNGIRPMATLYHWDLPGALDDRGGWLNRDIAGWFADYAAAVVRVLGDRVEWWATLNEPWVVTDGGYLHGVHAPGRSSKAEAAVASRNLMLAHGSAMPAIRAHGGRQAGLVVNLEPKYPATDRPEDVAATARADAYMNRQYLDPVFRRESPAELVEMYGPDWSPWETRDYDIAAAPLDFLGINYYTRAVTRHAASVPLTRAAKVHQPQSAYTALDWEVHPESLTDVLLWVHQRYGSLPLFITENGAAFVDPPVVQGDRLDDPLRVSYLSDHLQAAHRAIDAGVNLRGYFAWSLFDNFEWAEGYSKRFGLIHVDFQSQKRTLKSSARFYADVIRTHGEVLATR